MTDRRRKDDMIIDEIRQDVKNILKILNPHNGNLGLVAQTEVNRQDIEGLKKRPSNIKSWLVAAAVLINTLVAAGALWRSI